MSVRVLVIDNYDSFTFNLLQLLEECGGCTYAVVKNDQLDLARTSEFDKILISPGPGTPTDAGRLLKVIAEIGSAKSILGVCLGHQAIAQSYGGTLVQTPLVAHGIVKDIVVEASDSLFRGLPKSFPVGLYHSWAVDESTLPEVLRVTAHSTDGVVMALAHRSFDVRGVQFHPESILTPAGTTLLRNWVAD